MNSCCLLISCGNKSPNKYNMFYEVTLFKRFKEDILFIINLYVQRRLNNNISFFFVFKKQHSSRNFFLKLILYC